MRPDSLLRLWHYINHLLTYLQCHDYGPAAVTVATGMQCKKEAAWGHKTKRQRQWLHWKSCKGNHKIT